MSMSSPAEIHDAAYTSSGPGIHFACFLHTLRDDPVTVARSMLQRLIFLAYFYFSTYVEFVLGFVIF